MAAHIDELTSYDLYVKYTPGQVFETLKLIDVCSGMNPCYNVLAVQALPEMLARRVVA